MVAALFDTNILIDFLNGSAEAKEELQRYGDRAISVVTWMEVLIGTDEATAAEVRRFLSGFHLIGVDEAVAEAAVHLRRNHRIKLPEAIVWAAAQVHGRLFITRNTKDFSTDDPGIRFPYVLG